MDAQHSAVMAEVGSQTQTQTQGSQVEWSQGAAPSIPVIWGRLYRTAHKHCWRSEPGEQPNTEYLDLTTEEFNLGRALTCNFIMKKDIIKDEIIKNVSKLHFVLKRDITAPLSPAVLVDCSYNGTFVNGERVGRGRSRVLDDKDEIAITHPNVKIFLFKDLLKNEQDQVPREVSQKYYVSRTLGQGACGIVKLVYNKHRCTRHAMKIIKKSRLTNGQVNNNKNNLNNPQKIMNEVNILKQLRHPCIISTEEIFESRDAVYIVLELMEGGELFDRITQLGRLPEPLTKLLFRQVVLAVQYLHSQGITHRDLKPENVLLEGSDEETVVKITDFGLSKLVGEDSFMKTMCGTPLYLAPEILAADGRSGYGPQVDVWSLGVIFFICLSGYLPFSGDYPGLTLREQILQGRYTYSEPHWRGVSPQAKMLMRRMLTVRPERRATLADILQSDWMQDNEIINRVNQLLTRSAHHQFSQLSVASSHSDEENRTLCDQNKAQSGQGTAHSITSQEKTHSSQDKTRSGQDKTHSSQDKMNPSQIKPQNRSSQSKAVLSLQKPKRMLSDSFSSCEPIPKKMRLGMSAVKTDKNDDIFLMKTHQSDDTTSTKSMESDESNYLIIVEGQ